MAKEETPGQVVVRYVYRLEARVNELLSLIKELEKENKELKQWQSDKTK